MEASGFSFKDKPKWKWHCDKCEFVTSVGIHAAEIQPIIYVDVYKSCTEGYVFVYSNKDGDYHSSVTQNLLFAYYALDHLPQE